MHLTRERDLDFLKRIGFLPPSVYLQIACCRLARQILPEVNMYAWKGEHYVEAVLSSHLKGLASSTLLAAGASGSC